MSDNRPSFTKAGFLVQGEAPTAPVRRTSPTTEILREKVQQAGPYTLPKAWSVWSDDLTIVSDSPPTRSRETTVTPNDASLALERNVSNRPLAETRAKKYASDMTAGLWKYSPDPIVFSWVPNDLPYLLNGQHRLRAIVLSGTSQPMKVEFYPDSEISRADLFSVMDGGAMRDIPDRLSTTTMHGKTVREIKSVSIAITALSVVEKLVPHGQGVWYDVTPQAKLDLAAKHPEDIAWAAQLRLTQPKEIRRLPIGFIAAAISAHRADEEQADSFFTRVITGEMLRVGEPEYELRKEILDPTSARVKSRSFGSNSAAEHMWWFGMVLSAWQHRLAGNTSLSMLRPKHPPVGQEDFHKIARVRERGGS